MAVVNGLLLQINKYRPLLSSKKPHFQNEAKCITFPVKISFICMRMKNHFYIKGWVLVTSFWYGGPGELRNDLSGYQVMIFMLLSKKK